MVCAWTEFWKISESSSMTGLERTPGRRNTCARAQWEWLQRQVYTWCRVLWQTWNKTQAGALKWGILYTMTSFGTSPSGSPSVQAVLTWSPHYEVMCNTSIMYPLFSVLIILRVMPEHNVSIILCVYSCLGCARKEREENKWMIKTDLFESFLCQQSWRVTL